MSTVLSVVLTINIGIILFLLWRIMRLRRELSALKARAKVLDPELAGPPAELAELFKESRSSLIAIEILNAMELASKESWFVGVFGSLSPRLVRRKVYDQAAGIIQDQLKDFGVEADVRVHRGQ